MARYIDADALKERLEDFSKWCKDGRKQGVDFVLDCPLPDMPTADVAPRAEWIRVEERLPNDQEWVQVYDGNRRYKILRFEKGIDEDTREKMRTGEIPDPETTGWTKTDGFFMIKRSKQFKAADVFGNNMVPYCWRTEYGDTIFGQNITWWRNLPEPPEDKR